MTAASGSRATKQLRWLRDELEKLAEAQVLDTAALGRLRAYYGLDSLPQPRNLSLLIFGVMGAALFGAGVILIVAHNWEELARVARAGVALGLLALAQGVAGWVLATRPRSPTWTEASALTLTLFAGASIALISQTYHIEGELGDFLVTWLTLVIPVFYLLRARVAAALCLALALGVPSAHSQLLDRNLAYVVLAAACLPYVFWTRRHQLGQARTALLGWAAAISIPLGLASVLSNALGPADDVALLFFAAFFAALLAWGRTDEVKAPGAASPLSSVGLAGVAGLALALSFEATWPWPGAADLRADLAEPAVRWTLFAAAVISAYPLWRGVSAARMHDAPLAVAMALPLVAAIGSLALPRELAMIAGNLFAFALGLAFVLSGLEAIDLRRTNAGLVILALLFGLRFVDSDLSLLTRGLGMMGVGLAFAAMNVWLVRRRRQPGAAEDGAGA